MQPPTLPPPKSKGIATCGDGGGRKANEIVVQFPPTPMKTTQAPTTKLEFKPNIRCIFYHLMIKLVIRRGRM